MGPELNEVVFVLERAYGRAGQALEDPGDIAQILDVVAFGRGGQQFFGGLDARVELDRAAHDVVAQVGYVLGQALGDAHELPLQDVGEDARQGVGLEGLDVEHVEVAQVAHGDVVSAAGRGQHRADEGDVLQLLELLGLQVVPAAVVHPLAQEFDGGLRALFLLRGHIEVVDEDDDLLLALFGAVVALPPPGADFAFNQLLDLVHRGLSREGRAQVCVFGVEVVALELVYYVHSFSCSGRAREQHVDLVLDAEVQELVVAHAVGGGNQQLVELHALGGCVYWDCLHPVHPHLLGAVLAQLEDAGLLGYLCVDCLGLLGQLEVQIELLHQIRGGRDQLQHEFVEGFARALV